MALVKVKILGSSEVKEYSVDTVGELKTELGKEDHAANVGGEPRDNDFRLSDADLVTLAPAVKGGK